MDKESSNRCSHLYFTFEVQRRLKSAKKSRIFLSSVKSHMCMSSQTRIIDHTIWHKLHHCGSNLFVST